ncbi:MAG: hypothetical protein EOO43_01770 [Flavobacterium sp.]|nr:MAG: hypothetical protein EOO43_01770 [Flavobacterium sp.]
MRPILMTSNITHMAKQYAETVFTTRINTFVRPRIKLQALSTALGRKRTLSRDYKNYVDRILEKLDLLYRIKPDFFHRFHVKYFSGFNVNLAKVIKVGDKNQAFYKHISEAMRYDAVRDKEFLPYVKKLKIKSCVYCNASYALSINQAGDDYGKFELDHYKPQSRFPYLCTNFYNLTPSCSNCNKYKLKADSEFCLYVNNYSDLDQFEFKLDKRSIIKYMLHRNPEDLKITFHAHNHHGHEKLFKINATYYVLKDIAEEIIWKSKIYNSSYLKSIQDAFNRKFLGGNFYRFLLGNYDKPEETHNRPLSKMSQDLARQLGIIE